MTFNKQDWPIRKIIYLALGLVLFIALTTGLVTDEQIQGALGTAQTVAGYLAAGGLLFATARTHRGSDDPTTQGDLLSAIQNAGSTDQWAAQVNSRLKDIHSQLSAPVATAAVSASVEPAQPALPADPETEPGVYPGA